MKFEDFAQKMAIIGLLSVCYRFVVPAHKVRLRRTSFASVQGQASHPFWALAWPLTQNRVFDPHDLFKV